MTSHPDSLSFWYARRNSPASRVQPGVNALGKKNTTTERSRSSSYREVVPTLKSGAVVPFFNMSSLRHAPHRALEQHRRHLPPVLGGRAQVVDGTHLRAHRV